MNRRIPSLAIVDPNQLASGLAPDRHTILQPLWERAANVRFYQGKIRRLVPPALMFAAGAAGGPIRGLSQHQASDGVRWVWTANGPAIYKWYGPAATLVTTMNTGHLVEQTSQRPATYFDFTHYGDWTLINSGYGAALLHKPPPDNTTAAIATAPVDVVRFMKKKNMIMAVGYGPGKRLVGWSKQDDITNWAFADPASTAGELAIEELDTPIRAGVRLGDHVACYTEDQLGIVSWIGSPFYFGQRVALDGIGAVGKMAVATDGRLNYGVSRNGCWQTDGQQFRYIDEMLIGDYFQDNVNWDASSKVIVCRNDVTRCIEFHFPMGDSLEVNEAWSYDPRAESWSPIIGYELMMERTLFDKPIYASDGQVLLADHLPTTEAPMDLETKAMLMEGPEGVTLHINTKVDEVEFALKAAVGIEFGYGVAERTEGPWTWSKWYKMHTDLRTYGLEDMPSGTFHKLRFRSTIVNWDMDLQGFAMFGISDGQKRDKL